ncbi:MAG: acetyl-CoA carboxylase biotin carboxyl carrier protein subunit [Bacteroidetes bacterium GWE2_29_8]|nr:MAG: acetyl-CoA carboxylase biotin carboxyl carrier protein subunit [Bacteroidetes bacterium GWE2_29_8]OFY24658.1 MAG: acetyl-CoA carboxylase biotin carboxyl carrier protein subunit [Bacteroidetes bacterium GWF2_29_10]
MKKFKFNIHGNQYEVQIVNIEDNIAEVEVNGTSYQVEVDSSLQQTKTPKLVRTLAVPSTDSVPSTQKTSNPESPKGVGYIKTPLPGVLLDIFVRVGDVVKTGQKLAILEAMKMENNIDSDKDGKITEIRVQRGDSVLEGDVLFVIGA